mmetsp:Transcript_11803/g.21811  ORF Transcript_11803/g.21811 Transcript_11803/m.21811 type:complete len:102 (-) Transcript_11803:134-439(-)
MLFTIITFFQKFALILFFTVIQATVGSFIFLLTFLDCIGPTNPTYLVDKYIDCCTKATTDNDSGVDASRKRNKGSSSKRMDGTSRTAATRRESKASFDSSA